MIFFSQEYHDDKGATIIHNNVVEGIAPEDFPKYLGVGYVSIPTPMGQVDEKITVKIEASSLQEAFILFRETMERDGPAEVQKVVEAFKQKMMELHKQQQSKIVQAHQLPLPPFQGLKK